MDMEAFLAAQTSAGQFESQGGFTVAMDKARQKLGKFQLQDSSFYLLKAVQAAVSGGAGRVDLRTSRNKLALWFDTPEPLGSFEELLAALRNPLETPPGPLKFLALGFNAGLASEPEQVCLVWWGGETGRALVAKGDELVATVAPDRPEGVSESANLYMFSVVKKRASWLSSGTAGEHAAVTKHCLYAPIEFRVDGRLLNGSHQPAAKETWLDKFSLPFHLLERATPSLGGGVSVRTPPSKGRVEGATGWLRSKRNQETFCFQPLLKPLPPEVRCTGAYALPLGLRGEDRITFVCHGVTVSHMSVRAMGAGAAAIVSADDLSYDLSGFGLIRDEKFWASVASVQEVWKEMAESLREDIRSLTSTVTDEEKAQNDGRNKEGIGYGFYGCLGAALVMAVFPALPDSASIALYLGFPILTGAVPHLRPRPDPHRALQDMVVARLDDLRASSWPYAQKS